MLLSILALVLDLKLPSRHHISGGVGVADEKGIRSERRTKVSSDRNVGTTNTASNPERGLRVTKCFKITSIDKKTEEAKGVQDCCEHPYI